MKESAELLRSLPDSFKPTLDPDKAEIDLYPPHLRSQIDELSPWIQSDLNAGVYKAGFAPDQEAYDTNVVLIFAALNRLESLISESGGPYILGKQLTELDIRAYTTIVRFDVSLLSEFPRCNNLRLLTSAANICQLLQCESWHDPTQLPGHQQLAQESLLEHTRLSGNNRL